MCFNVFLYGKSHDVSFIFHIKQHSVLLPACNTKIPRLNKYALKLVSVEKDIFRGQTVCSTLKHWNDEIVEKYVFVVWIFVLPLI
jgi:hypothetical protein